MKKVLAIVLALCMTLTMASGALAEETTHKLGYNYFGTGGYSLAVLANNTKIVADAFEIESVAMDDQFSVEQIVTDVENMIAAGCDGVNVWMVVPPLYPTIGELCKSKGVYFALNDKVPTDQGIKETLMANEYFAGACAPANAIYGQELAEYALEQGWQTCIITSSTVGDASDQPRLDAFLEAFTSNGGIVVDELHADTTAESLVQIQDSLVANGEVDFIFGVGSDFAINACTALENYPDWRTKVISSGLDKEALGLLNDPNSPMVMLNGDNWVSGIFSALILLNAMTGNMLKDADGNPIFIDDVLPFEVSVEKYPLFEKYMMNQNMYSDEEMKALVGCTYDEFVAAVRAFSLDERLMAKYEAGIISAEEMTAAGYQVQ